MQPDQNRLNQLFHFLKNYKHTDGLYFKLHFSKLNLKKITLDLVDFYDKTPLSEPVFSPDCAKNNKKICLFNLKTLNNLLKGEEFDESTTIICPICKNSSTAMSFYYEESILKIIKKIKNFINNNEEKPFKISVKSNFHWKTKNFVYLKGKIKFDEEDLLTEETKKNVNSKNPFEFFDDDFEDEKNFEIGDLDEKECPIILKEGIELKGEMTSLDNKKEYKTFTFIPQNMNFLFTYKILKDGYDFKSHRIFYNKKGMVPLIFYENYVFLNCEKDELYIINDAGSVFKKENVSEISIFGGSNNTNIVMNKFLSFERRFHSPKVHYFKGFIYFIGGYTIDQESLKQCYKVPISGEKKTAEYFNLPEMINFRKDYDLIHMEKSQLIYIYGGKILKNQEFKINNACFDRYDLNTNLWEEVLIMYNEFSEFNELSYDFSEKNEKNIIIFGKNDKFYVNLEDLTEKKNYLNWNPNKDLSNLASALRDSMENFKEINYKKDKNLAFLKYY